MKLLSKRAEDRYQGAEGLRFDLERILNGERDFPLGQKDVPARFLLPQRLYGRHAEVATLLEAFERVAQTGRPEWVLVRGYSGIGKSSVVKELHQPVLRSRGFFLRGKFEQYQRDKPYAPLVQALRGLIQHLLAGSDAELATGANACWRPWKDRARCCWRWCPSWSSSWADSPPWRTCRPRRPSTASTTSSNAC
ncbi:AAA family ATPase [Cystobacter fuscus]